MPRGLAPATTVVQRAAASGTIISSQISRNEKVRVVLLSPGSHEKSTNRHEGFTGGCGNGVLVCDMHTWIGTNRVSQRIAASISVLLSLNTQLHFLSCPRYSGAVSYVGF